MLQDILSTKDLDRNEIEKIMGLAQSYLPVVKEKRMLDVLKGKILAALFYEPSTRTRLSFETAMHRLGGEVLTVAGMEGSSLTKGETLHDTAKVIENFVDIIAIRHPQIGSAKMVAEAASIPVINAGDGAGEHPTQALLDLFTIKNEQQKLDGLTIAFIGDLKFGRTVHSLLYLLGKYKISFIFVSPESLRMPEEVTSFAKQQGIKYSETSSIEDALKHAQVLYVTRIQKERFEDQEEYEKLKDAYVINRELIERFNQQTMIMHPLPRVNEITTDIDTLPGAAYFRQVQNGVAVRMALLQSLLIR